MSNICDQDSNGERVNTPNSDRETDEYTALDEANARCANRCVTEADYKVELFRVCRQPDRCPDYLLEEIESWLE